MSWLASFVLSVVHFAYSFVTFYDYVKRRLGSKPQPLFAPRRRIPSHLALLLIGGDALDDTGLTDTLRSVVEWSSVVGIERLTVYDREGSLAADSDILQSTLCPPDRILNGDSDRLRASYPLTPPLSDVSESRPRTPEEPAPQLGVSTIYLNGSVLKRQPEADLKRRAAKGRDFCDTERKPLTLHVVSRECGKPAIANVTRSFVSAERSTAAMGAKKPPRFELSVKELESILEGEGGFPGPDLMIVHHCSLVQRSRAPLELYGFPPWQVRLTEIHYNEHPAMRWFWRTLSGAREGFVPLEEADFRGALDEFAVAEMRQGK